MYEPCAEVADNLFHIVCGVKRKTAARCRSGLLREKLKSKHNKYLLKRVSI